MKKSNSKSDNPATTKKANATPHRDTKAASFDEVMTRLVRVKPIQKKK